MLERIIPNTTTVKTGPSDLNALNLCNQSANATMIKITVEFKASNLEKELITTDRQELLEILKRQDKKVG